jgi:hypothetical protein
MITDKIIKNKIYLYSGTLYKVKTIQKGRKRVVIQSLLDDEEVVIPLDGAPVLLSRVYTIGEVAKIVERRADTIRKYERSGLIPKPISIDETYNSYKNWRFYTGSDVYEMVEFFSNRNPGRPKNSSLKVDANIKHLDQKVKLTNRSIVNAK